MERAALAAVVAVTPAQNLGQQASRVTSARQYVAVIAVGGKQQIIGAEQRQRGDARRFLSDVDMVMASKATLPMETDEALLEMPDEQHPPALIEQLGFWQPG
jgi:hypothetical protein